MILWQSFLRMTSAALVRRGDAVVALIASRHPRFVAKFGCGAVHQLSVTINALQLTQFCVRGVGNNQIACRSNISLEFMADVAILIDRLGVKTGNIAVALT